MDDYHASSLIEIVRLRYKLDRQHASEQPAPAAINKPSNEPDDVTKNPSIRFMNETESVKESNQGRHLHKSGYRMTDITERFSGTETQYWNLYTADVRAAQITETCPHCGFAVTQGEYRDGFKTFVCPTCGIMDELELRLVKTSTELGGW